MGYLYGKGMFMIFVALLMFDPDYPVDTAMAICMTLVGFFNLLVMCLAPGTVMPPNFFGKSKEDAFSGSDASDYDENSENDANEHDGLLPRTFSAKPEKSGAGMDWEWT